MLLLISALGLGFLHGLGGDHLMAIATLSMDGARNRSAAVRRGEAIAIASRFALGHALLLGLGAGAIVLIGWTIPPHVERGGEMLGGGLLVIMGLLTLQHLRGRRAHPKHVSHPTHPAHPTHLPTIIGAAFAISSLRAIAMLTPFGDGIGTAPLPLLLALIGIFALGILASMVLFGIALAGVLSTSALQRVGHAAGALVGVSSIVLGVVWVASA